jgi:hypothetical protein
MRFMIYRTSKICENPKIIDDIKTAEGPEAYELEIERSRCLVYPFGKIFFPI